MDSGGKSHEHISKEDNESISPRRDSSKLEPALPEGVCAWRRNNFIRFGCAKKESAYCSALSRSMTKEILGKPACLAYPCEGYGNPVGFFLCNSTCQDGTYDKYGICADNDICCLT